MFSHSTLGWWSFTHGRSKKVNEVKINPNVYLFVENLGTGKQVGVDAVVWIDEAVENKRLVWKTGDEKYGFSGVTDPNLILLRYTFREVVIHPPFSEKKTLSSPYSFFFPPSFFSCPPLPLDHSILLLQEFIQQKKKFCLFTSLTTTESPFVPNDLYFHPAVGFVFITKKEEEEEGKGEGKGKEGVKGKEKKKIITMERRTEWPVGLLHYSGVFINEQAKLSVCQEEEKEEGEGKGKEIIKSYDVKWVIIEGSSSLSCTVWRDHLHKKKGLVGSEDDRIYVNIIVLK